MSTPLSYPCLTRTRLWPRPHDPNNIAGPTCENKMSEFFLFGHCEIFSEIEQQQKVRTVNRNVAPSFFQIHLIFFGSRIWTNCYKQWVVYYVRFSKDRCSTSDTWKFVHSYKEDSVFLVNGEYSYVCVVKSFVNK